MAPPRGLTVAVVALLIAGAVLAAAQREPWDPDETRYLQVTREMLRSGNPFLLTFSGEPYADKPPLHFWLLAPWVAALGAESAAAGMIPSLLALLAVGWATRRLGDAAGLSDPAAHWGGILTMTALLPAVAAGGCRMDLPFVLWCTLALTQLARLAADRGAVRREHLLLWTWLGLGILTKGPLALALPVLAALALIPADRGRLLRRAVVGWGPLLALVMVAAWLVPAALMAGPTWLQTILVDQSAGRMVSSFAHREPWWYHLATIPLTLLPWSPLAAGGLISLLRRPRVTALSVRLLPAYALAGLCLFSVLSGKTFLYPMVLFPALALVAASWLVERPGGTAPRACMALGGLMATAIGAGLALVVAPRPDMALGTAAALVLGGSLVIPGAVATLGAMMGRARASATALCLVVPLFAAAGLQTLVPPFNRLLSLRPFGSAYADADRSIEPGLAYGKVQPGFLLFADRPFLLLEEPEELEEALNRGRVVAINIKRARSLEQEQGLGWRVVDEIPYRHTRIQLLASRDSPD